ncbi:fatty acid desaturase family protein [Kordiimonas laminariae]|uniref:fatty acid desaturase family protein n=1 Tax=Kordiimonas laminariae TaxID=2917717 RepID=UPI001FF5CB6B|nr:fatty acid desaturase family protein [Kordiimonas laminariae]MCK0069031.1 fatty acid desaturase family protein [Kordiimonas laminariae]
MAKHSSTQWQIIKPSDILTKEESHRIRQRSDAWGFWLVFHCWAMIAAAWALYLLLPNPITFFVMLIVVGGRQLGLSILMHEGSHGMLFRTRNLNERITQWFTAWPVLLNVHGYRIRHMAHHRFTRTEKDPENFLYTPFPVTKPSMARKFLRDLTGIAFVRTNVGLFRYFWGEKEGRGKRLFDFYAGPIFMNAVMFAGFFLAGMPELYFLMWLLPLATTYMLVLRIRNIAEHCTMPDLEDPLKNSRTTLANIFERATVAPYWVNYHIEHHVLPFVPCYRLKEVHKLMLEKGYGERMEIKKGYWDVLKLNAAL